MSGHPEDPRVFSQSKILVPISLVTSLALTLVMYFPISDYVAGRSDDIFSILVPGLFTLFCYVLLLHGLVSRFGVDRALVWQRFGKLFFRQVRLEDFYRYVVCLQRYKLHTGVLYVKIDYILV